MFHKELWLASPANLKDVGYHNLIAASIFQMIPHCAVNYGNSCSHAQLCQKIHVQIVKSPSLVLFSVKIKLFLIIYIFPVRLEPVTAVLFNAARACNMACGDQPATWTPLSGAQPERTMSKCIMMVVLQSAATICLCPALA